MTKQPVPFLDLASTYTELEPELDAAYRRVMKSGWFLLGEELEAFEAEFAASTGATHCVGVASGLDALVLALRAMGLGPGDEIIVPSNTFIATWLAVTAVGATIVPVEPNPATHVIEADAIARAITPRTGAIVPVHLYGCPVDLDDIGRLAVERGIRLLHDAAQAHGATYKSGLIGSMGNASAWSFYPAKNLGAYADAGAITTNDDTLAASVRRLRNYGSDEKYVNQELGVNSRLDELQAAFLRVRLEHLGEWNERRGAIARRYHEALQDLPLQLHQVPIDRVSSWHLYVIRTTQRDRLKGHMDVHGVECNIHYPIPPHRQQAYRDAGFDFGSLPIAENLAGEVLSLPIGPHMTDAQVEATVAAVRSFDW